MNLTAPQMESAVSRIVTRLAERERRVYALRLHQLSMGIDPTIFVRHATLHLVLPDLAFLRQFAAADNRHSAVAALQEALSWGMRIHISLHRQLLGALPVKALSRLPLSFSDHQGHDVRLFGGPLLSYRDIAAQKPGWLVVQRKTLITPLVRDSLLSRHIQLLRQE
ncbi:MULTISPECIES: microcompartment protein PduM [unclassified Brenneria]|uniref:microcompartment protein PduM n=1 Tax=unclassified Brenneria TaxID=2634434 RepID=UPI001555EF87|nr:MULTISPECIES: microcompartment protein PduM [unclassified Brenneria]MBJ7221573.1 microcompartment protein PduM [Brenneria sp. L3-3C-1]MEE3642815.1 microcompartment protein PduM [Brenneria sp. L3_3C_1]MEE3651003.1 microcompartment protein PduM [Brenneria sp. HEZEL_4_2_4]NPD00958.1 microcompartment protein PduM [Brenneria sp. hezel4-2-4]